LRVPGSISAPSVAGSSVLNSISNNAFPEKATKVSRACLEWHAACFIQIERIEVMKMTTNKNLRGLRLMRSALLALATLAVPATSFGGVILSVAIAPPVLPVYAQPICPGPGYMWTPGYWAYGPAGYYWVGGNWVLAPYVGALWTPGYWGWSGGLYIWHGGYWGHHVGFYGGVNYGFGYTGVGYAGGYWHNGVFAYNRAVNHVSGANFHTYSRTVASHETSHVSYNGGKGGLTARPNHAASGSHGTHSNGQSAHLSSAHAASHASAAHSSSAHAHSASYASATHSSSHAHNVSHSSGGHAGGGHHK